MSESVNIKLKHPLARDGSQIETIPLRRPLAGDMKGVSQHDILRMVPEAVCTLVTRISEPMLPASQFWMLDPTDLLEVSGRVVGFFVDLENSPAT